MQAAPQRVLQFFCVAPRSWGSSLSHKSVCLPYSGQSERYFYFCFGNSLDFLHDCWQLASSIIAAMHASSYIPPRSPSLQATMDAVALAELFQKLSRASLVLSETIYLSLSVNTFFLFVYLPVALPLSRCLSMSV